MTDVDNESQVHGLGQTHSFRRPFEFLFVIDRPLLDMLDMYAMRIQASTVSLYVGTGEIDH